MKRALAVQAGRPRAGYAVLTVLLVLLALLVLSAPFLLAARNASRASAELADAAQLRLALDSASRFARLELAPSHPAVDATPYFDDLEELAARVDLEGEETRNPRGVMWDLEARDAAAEIDLSSAPPQVFANILGASTRLARGVKADDAELPVSTTSGFEERGFVWVGRELIGYGALEPQAFKALKRGLGAREDAEGKPLSCGPQPAQDHAAGAVVLDQRAFAPVLWRNRMADGRARRYDAPEQVRDATEQALAGLDPDATGRIGELTSAYAGVRAGREWQRASRLASPVVGGETCELKLDSTRWMNRGTTVEIFDGVTRELGIVQAEIEGGIRLMEPLVNDYQAFAAEVRPLARRAVNVNTARPEVLEVLLANLQMAGVNQRVTRDEARVLSELIVASRPFTGFEDFLRRIVLPAAGLEALPEDAPLVPEALKGGGGLIDAEDAKAIYANALNANDSRLGYSTMPFAFVTRDVHRLELRAAVNARSGAERASGVREEVAVVVPQRDLLQVWARQEDFDELMRLDAEAPWWTSGPSATSRWDGGAVPPTRFWAHFGTAGGVPYPSNQSPLAEPAEGEPLPSVEHVFASRDEDGWAQLWAARVDEAGPRRGRVLHFDHETRDPEGRYLPDEVIDRKTSDAQLGWSSPQLGLLRGFSLSMWFKLRQIEDSLLLDVGRQSLENDRVTVGLEGEDLVVRVLDAAGDHPATKDLIEAGEARFALAPGKGAGIPRETWMHLALDVRGTRPDQITALVDGRTLGVRTLGLSRLAAPLPDGGSVIQLEDAEGFPEQGVARIGEEVIEFTRMFGSNVLTAQRQETGPNAGFGGRLARESFDLSPSPYTEPGVNTGLTVHGKNTDHDAGTPVTLYGYSLPLVSNVPATAVELPFDLGPFRVGYVEEVILDNGQQGFGEDISVYFPNTLIPELVGQGIEGHQPQKVSGLILSDADRPGQPGQPLKEGMKAFGRNGGYAALIQKNWDPSKTVNNTPLGGIEIIQYSGYDENASRLNVIGRGIPGTATAPPSWVAHAFIVHFLNQNDDLNSELENKVFVVPISLTAPNVGGVGGFSDPSSTGVGSEFIQLTHAVDAELTEWVRYDQILGKELARNRYEDLLRLQLALSYGPGTIDPPVPSPGAGAPDPPAPQPPPSPPARQGSSSSDWLPYIGESEELTPLRPVTRAARQELQFRGVLGTYSHGHKQGTPILPVWRVDLEGPDRGMPGRMDPAFLIDQDPSGVPFPVRVHRAYRPLNHEYIPWQPGANALSPVSGPPQAKPEVGYATSYTYVALQERCPVPFAPTSISTPGQEAETRALSRLVMHPSGERPRIVDRAVIGGSIQGGLVPSALVDEIVFGSTAFGGSSQAGEATQGASLKLMQDLAPGEDTIYVHPHVLRTARSYAEDQPFLAALPEDAGLLRIGGSEIVCYQSRNPDDGTLRIAPGGRGLLGTQETPHATGEAVTFLDAHTVGVLATDVSANDSSLPLTSIEDFPMWGATVLLGGELAHYTRLAGGALDMPRRSSIAGKMDQRGEGVFRGRFGTAPAACIAGTPVIHFPFRYWDRWSERFDGPELAYFGFVLDQPNAFWRSVFWQAEEPQSGAARIEVLQRVDQGPDVPVHWDGDPSGTKGLALHGKGLVEGRPNAIGEQSSRVEWRAHVRYAPGAFDAEAGSSHGWKETPRLKRFGAEYLGPDQILRRVRQ